MNCPSCGAPLSENAKFCTQCGAAMASFPKPEAAPIPKAPEPPVMPYTPEPPVTPYTPEPVKMPEPNPYESAQFTAQYSQSYYNQPVDPSASLPPQYKPLGAWAYFGLNILYSIPVIGFIFLIVFSFSDSNINRRSHARSYWCGLLIYIALVIIIFVILLATGGLGAIADAMEEAFELVADIY